MNVAAVDELNAGPTNIQAYGLLDGVRRLSVTQPSIRIITDHGTSDSFEPYRVNACSRRRWSGSRLGAFLCAFAMWRESFRHEGVSVFVTYGGLAAFTLAWMQWLASPFRRPHTHLVFGLLLEYRRTGPIGLWDRVKMMGFRRVGARAVVWGQTDPVVYAREHGIPEQNIQVHPYHKTLQNFEYEVGDEGYIFSGGNQARDFPTLFEAVRDIECKVIVATNNPEVPAMAEGLDNVEVRSVKSDEFRRLMAKSHFVVEVHPADFVRTAGHQTMLNAMSMGKPLIVADRESAIGYVEDGTEGFVVDAEDPVALGAAIRRLVKDTELHGRMQQACLDKLSDPLYDTKPHMQSLYNFALQLEYKALNLRELPGFIELFGAASGGVVPHDCEGTRFSVRENDTSAPHSG